MQSNHRYLAEVREALAVQGARPTEEWLLGTLSKLPESSSAQQLKQDVFNLYLHQDLLSTSQSILPPSSSSTSESLLPQAGILQVIDARDAGTGDFAVLSALCDRMVWKAPKSLTRHSVPQQEQGLGEEASRPRKAPLLTLSDGTHAILAFELSPIMDLSIYHPLGLKVR